MKVAQENAFPRSEGHAVSGRGFSLLTATVFIIGEVAGGGILNLPHAVQQAGWSGVVMIVFCAICAGVSGLYLAHSWVILEERFPKYREGLTRKPFSTIGHHTYGPAMSAFVSILMNITRVGTTTVFLLLTSDLLYKLTNSFWNVSKCQWIPIVSVALLLPMWFGSPVDFWPIAYSAMISTAIGSLLLIAAIIKEINKNGFSNHYEFQGFESFSSAFGTILFAFGGASAFPNFQNDMREKSKFPRAVIFGFIGLLLLYVPTAGLGYAAFGTNVNKESILNNLESGPLVTIIEVFFLIHCASVSTIIINPVYLDMEQLLRIPKQFNWKRCLFRTLLLALMTFIGETFPSFGQILDLIGGSTVALMAFVLPPIFYMKLCSDSSLNPNWPQRTCSIYLKFFFAVVIASGIVGCISSTYTTLKHWEPISTACYIRSDSSPTNHNSSSFSNSTTF